MASGGIYRAASVIYHKKGFALSLILKARVFETQKWPINSCSSVVKPVNDVVCIVWTAPSSSIVTLVSLGFLYLVSTTALSRSAWNRKLLFGFVTFLIFYIFVSSQTYFMHLYIFMHFHTFYMFISSQTYFIQQILLYCTVCNLRTDCTYSVCTHCLSADSSVKRLTVTWIYSWYNSERKGKNKWRQR